MNDAVFASIVTTIGGLVSIVLAWFFSKRKVNNDYSLQIRDELRADIARYREESKVERDENTRLRREVDIWRDKYYLLQDKMIVLEDNDDDLKRENERLKAAVTPPKN